MPVKPQAVIVMPHFLAEEKLIGFLGSPSSNSTCGGCERGRGGGRKLTRRVGSGSYMVDGCEWVLIDMDGCAGEQRDAYL